MSEIRSRPQTAEYDEGHARTFGDRQPGQRGRWIWDDAAGKLVRAEDYVPQAQALHAPIIADRIHEGTTIDDGDRVRDIGSRRKRREFMAEKGVTDRSDYGAGWRERKGEERERTLDRRTHEAAEKARRQLYAQGKLR